MVASSTPAAGTSLVSIPDGVPTARMAASGEASRSAAAMARSGLMCPAVPPPARTMDGVLEVMEG
jgi:hypothetical protein